MNPLRLAWRLRRILTKPPAPYRLARKRPVTMAARVAMETALMWEQRTPIDLKELAMTRTSSLIGCTW